MKMEGEAEKTKRTRAIVSRLKKRFPEAKTALEFGNPLQLLVSTILSAQCTDVRVNMVTPELFRKYPSASAFARARQEELEQDIRSTGFYRNKAKNIIGSCNAIMDRHAGEVPAEMDALTALPGVGRKTANCVLGGAFGIQSGIVVDTHVLRLAERLDLSSGKTPEHVEQDLLKLVPKKDWYRFSNLVILHGRETCKARKPTCEACILAELCPAGKTVTKRNK